MKKVFGKIDDQSRMAFFNAKGIISEILKDQHGENKNTMTAVDIIISLVIGALVLGGLYAMFGDIVMPTLKTKIQNMFNFSG